MEVRLGWLDVEAVVICENPVKYRAAIRSSQILLALTVVQIKCACTGPYIRNIH